MAMRVKLDVPSWFYSRRASDWQMKLMFAHEMVEFLPEVQTGIIFNVIYSAKYILPKLLPRFLIGRLAKICSKIRSFLLGEDEPFILISQGDYPAIPRGGLVVWETYFAAPQQTADLKDFVPGGQNFWIRQLELYGNEVAKIAVRGQYSYNLLCSMYPQFSDKVVDLGFIHPEYPEISEATVIEKQMSKMLTILFVGRMAKYKGLERLLNALSIIRNEGFCNFELVIVSDFIDGKIDVPACDWIMNMGGMAHRDVLNIFARSQIFIMPSTHESYGLVYLESMASGCVTFVPDEPIQREFIANGAAGVIVNSFDIVGIVQELRKILANPDARVALALNGLQRYRKVYSQAVERQKWHDVLQELHA